MVSLSQLHSLESMASSGSRAFPAGANVGSADYELKNPARLYIWKGDITTLEVDAIVNAANQRMLGGGGVDGAIHRVAGPQLKEACAQVEEVSKGVRCPTGEARSTPGFELPSKFVIATVGPVYDEAEPEEMKKLLSDAYRNSLREAERIGAKTMAFPSISTGGLILPIHAGSDYADPISRAALQASMAIPSERRPKSQWRRSTLTSRPPHPCKSSSASSQTKTGTST